MPEGLGEKARVPECKCQSELCRELSRKQEIGHVNRGTTCKNVERASEYVSILLGFLSYRV